MRGRGAFGKIAAVLFVFALGLYASPKAAAAFKNVQTGAEAPAFKLADLSGNEVSLETFKGDNAVILVFWATWSGRSLDELRDVQKLVAEYGPKGLKAVAVNVEHEHTTERRPADDPEKAASLNLTFPVLLDKGLDTFRNYGVVAVPSTGTLGRGNVLRDAFNGYPSFVFLELKSQVETLLGMKPVETAVAAKADTSHKPTRPALLNYNLGRRLYAFGMADKAEPKLRAAAAADPAWAAPNVLLGEVLLSRSKKDPGEDRGGEEGVRVRRRVGGGERGGAHRIGPRILVLRPGGRRGAGDRRGAQEERDVHAGPPAQGRHPRPEGGRSPVRKR